MSSINVDTIKSREGGPPTLSKGVVVSAAATFSTDVTIAGVLTYEDVTNVDSIGIITARSGIKFGAAGIGGTIRANGDTTLAGVVTATSFSGAATGLTGVPGGQITGALAAVDGSALTGMANTANVNTAGLNVVGVATVGAGLTLADNVRAKFGNDGDLQIYHDSNNSFIRDSGTGRISIVTSQIQITNSADSQVMIKATELDAAELYFAGSKKFETTNSGTITTGISTVTVGTDLDGYKVEEGSYDTNALNGEFDFELENGHVQTHTGSTAGTYFPDFRVSSSQSLSSVMDVGDVVTATLIVTASNASHYCTAGIKIDNSTSNVTVEWIGSSAASAGKGAGYDIYTFTIQKTAATPAYLVIVNATDAG